MVAPRRSPRSRTNVDSFVSSPLKLVGSRKATVPARPRAEGRGTAKGKRTARRPAKRARREVGAGEEEDESESESDLSEADTSEDEQAGAEDSSSRSEDGAEKAGVDSDGWDENGMKRVVAKVIEAPKTGHVPAGQISPNLLGFLSSLQKPECNEREWFWAHELVYRYVLSNWNQFVEHLVPLLMDVDDELPFLPVKDLAYRIHRDIRFSNDKTPYKTNMSATFSRTGRKSRWAGYHISVSPNGDSLLAGGKWHPEKDDLAMIRRHILQRPRDLRRVIEEKRFVDMFGDPRPYRTGGSGAGGSGSKGARSAKGESGDAAKGKGKGKSKGEGKGKERIKEEEAEQKKCRVSLFGGEDELKNAPKIDGVDKSHPDIDLLKLRSFHVVRYFRDEEVLASDFKDKVVETLGTMRPLVHLLNRWLVPAPADEQGSDEEEDESEEEE